MLPVPPGQAPPFAVLTADDHRAWIFITAALGIAVMLVNLGIRAFIRYAVHFTLGLDDAAILTSTALGLIQTIMVFAATSKGLGESYHLIPAGNRDVVQQLYYASNLFYIFSLGVSRISSIVFFRRLTANPFHKRVVDCFLGVVATWIFASSLAVALQCNLARPWLLTEARCATGWFVRWEAVEIVGAVLEVMTWCVAAYTLVLNLQVPARRKFTVLSMFALRLPILIFIGMRLDSFDSVGFWINPTLSIAEFVCWTQMEMAFSILASTVPMLRVFFSGLPRKFGDSAALSQDDSPQTKSGGSKKRVLDLRSAIRLETFRSNLSNKSATKETSQTDGSEAFQYSVASCAPAAQNEGETNVDGRSVGSQESKAMIIRKDSTWAITYSH